MQLSRLETTLRRILSGLAPFSLVAALAPLPVQAAMAADGIQALVTSYQPTVTETLDASGFKHPGAGVTRAVLENMRSQVLARKEPWNTYFNQMLLSAAARQAPAIVNVNASESSKPRYVAFNSQGVENGFRRDALTAYTQALLYYVTGNETYRANALKIIRLWSQMDPAQYANYVDSHIHTGIALNRMVNAAEILRYSSYKVASLAWTEDDTAGFSTHLVNPVVATFNSSPDHFMNQHLYTTIAAMSGAIFTGNRALYDRSVEWFTVNKVAVDQGQNGAIKQLFRLVTRNDVTGESVTPAVQHVEMGRDQAHGAGDITNAEILARMMMAQGSKVDPVMGTVSTAGNAVGPYEFLDDRILHAAELWGAYMSGREIPWVPTAAHTDARGKPTVVYKKVANPYRGRLTQNTWELFYYYQYVRGVDMEKRAPNFTRIFARRTSYNWDGGDGGGDFWLFIPKAAEAEGSKFLVIPIVDPYREVEDRFTALDDNATAMKDGTASYVRVTATPAGSRLAVYGYAFGASSIGFRVRTHGVANMDVYGNSVRLPDTRGQWRYVSVATGLGDFLPLIVTGNGTTVDIDHINIKAGTLLSPPAFATGSGDLTLYAYTGSKLRADFLATAPGSSATVNYSVDKLPAGASLNASTGAFSWRPTQAGRYAFVIEASDGTTVATQRVEGVVSADRQATVDAVTAIYNRSTPYVGDTLAAYNSARADILGVIGTASDAVFFQKLDTLKSAVAALQPLTPVLSDGSIDYAHMLASSTFGKEVANALDDNPDTFVGQYLAKDLTHTLDFGPSFQVAATAFALQVRTSFPERVGGTVVYGSNDQENWTRLTPTETAVTEDLQTLAVQSSLQSQRYRFFKIQMVHPSSRMLELGEFHIFGTRYETQGRSGSSHGRGST